MKVLELMKALENFDPHSPVYVPSMLIDGSFQPIQRVEGHDNGGIGGGEIISLYPYTRAKNG